MLRVRAPRVETGATEGKHRKVQGDEGERKEDRVPRQAAARIRKGKVRKVQEGAVEIKRGVASLGVEVHEIKEEGDQPIGAYQRKQA